jgi:ATP-dependent RNA helicase DDX56/DBP9
MKRKLNGRDAPEAASLASKVPQRSSTFDSFGLDPRILQAIVQEKYSKPTPVQAKAIPLALEGKDILGSFYINIMRSFNSQFSARSQTGSGKTLAYVLPILQSILSRKSTSASSKATTALILVPTRELAGQVWKVIQTFTAFCAQEVRAENITKKEDDKVQRARLADSPDIIVATPGRVAAHLNRGALKLDNLRHIVIDEADLVLSYGYDEDLQNIAKAIPKGVQAFLMSSTLRAELDNLKGLFCRHPVVLELDDEEKDAGGGVTQYVVKCAEDEKFLLLFALFKLQLVKGKTIVFVGDIDRCYRVKLFLEQFGIKSCVLNSELPVNSRIHVVEEFNKGVYDIIIASDEQEVIGNELNRKRKSNNEADKEQGEEGSAPNGQGIESAQKEATNENEQYLEEPSAPPKKKRRRDRDPDYGISRGIDFKNVTCVLNFDLPSSSKSYTHRIGRTGRAGKTGMAISFVIPESQYKKHKSLSILSTKEDEFVLKKIVKAQQKKGREIKDYSFDMKKLEGFRYRLQSALSAVSASAIREARIRELRQELIKSEKLKRHFEENPDELRHLRHDGDLRAARVKGELKHVPDYLLPGGGTKKLAEDVGFVGLRKRDVDGNRIRKARQFNRSRGKGRRDSRGGGGRKNNPLKTFKVKC